MDALMFDKNKLESISAFVEKHGLAASLLVVVSLVLAYIGVTQPKILLTMWHDLLGNPWLIIGGVGLIASYLAIQSLAHRIDILEAQLDRLRTERDLEKKLRVAVQREWLHEVTSQGNILTVAEAWAAMDQIIARETEVFQKRDYNKRSKLRGEHER